MVFSVICMNTIEINKWYKKCQLLLSYVKCFNPFPVTVGLVAHLGSVVDAVEEHPDVSEVHAYLADNLEYLMIERWGSHLCSGPQHGLRVWLAPQTFLGLGQKCLGLVWPQQPLLKSAEMRNGYGDHILEGFLLGACRNWIPLPALFPELYRILEWNLSLGTPEEKLKWDTAFGWDLVT